MLQAHQDGEPGITDHQQAEHANAERGAKQQSEGDDVAPARVRQVACRAQQEIGRAHHGGGERNVLGVVEHRAVPRPAHRQGESGDGAGARPRHQPRGRAGGADAGDPGQRAQDMAHRIGIEKRQQPLEQQRQDVEQAAVQIKIDVVEQRLVGEAAGVIGNDQLAVMLLHFLVVGDGVGIVGGEGERQQYDQQRGDREIIAVASDKPRAQAQVEPRQANLPLERAGLWLGLRPLSCGICRIKVGALTCRRG